MTHDANTWRPVASTQPVRATGRGAAARITRAPEGLGIAGVGRAAQYRRARNGLARHADPALPGWQRFLRNPYLWLTLLLTGLYGWLGYLSYRIIGNNLILEMADYAKEHNMPTLEATWPQVNEAYWSVTKLAFPTLGFFLVFFVLIDRLRPTSLLMKWLALGWGATVAVFVSLHVNSWAGDLMRAEGPIDPAQGARSAIFSAPFVEEAAKATVLFILAILLRRRMVSVHQVFTLSGLSAVGFAFSENIVYYLRVFIWITRVPGEEVRASVDRIVLLRGAVLCFGHPLFTAMTAFGLVVGLQNRSKLVRVLAPVTGYLAAAFGHMLFNGFASISGDVLPMAVGGWMASLAIVVLLAFRYITQTRNIRARLTEMVQLGWLQPTDPMVFSSLFGRWRMAFAGLLRGPRVFSNTLRLQRIMTELANVREAELRGTIDAMAIERERELILDAGVARVWAVDRNAGVRVIPPEWGEKWRAWRRRRREWRAQCRAAKAGASGAWGASAGAPVPTTVGGWPPGGR